MPALLRAGRRIRPGVAAHPCGPRRRCLGRSRGQKVWSSFASDADFGLFLARSDPEAAKPHAGITMFILPMHDPAVTVRPLVDIAGGHHFNEVFVSGGESARSWSSAAVNKGWRVASSTLGGERSGYTRWVRRRPPPAPTGRGRGAARPSAATPWRGSGSST